MSSGIWFGCWISLTLKPKGMKCLIQTGGDWVKITWKCLAWDWNLGIGSYRTVCYVHDQYCQVYGNLAPVKWDVRILTVDFNVHALGVPVCYVTSSWWEHCWNNVWNNIGAVLLYIFLLPVVATYCLPSLFFLLHCIHFIVCVLTVIIDTILTCLLIHAQDVECILVESLDI